MLPARVRAGYMIEYRIATIKDIGLMMNSRLEMLRIVNDLPADYVYSDEIVRESRDYFINGDQTTVLAIDDKIVVGCASISYMRLMPTFSHPTGKRAHLMNVYTNSSYRRQGVARKMCEILINDARDKGVTEISLDATESGRLLYKSLGFKESEECMVLTI